MSLCAEKEEEESQQNKRVNYSCHKVVGVDFFLYNDSVKCPADKDPCQENACCDIDHRWCSC